MLRIQFVDTCDKVFIFLRKKISNSIDELIVMTMSLSAFFESRILRSGLLVVVS